MQTHDFVLSHFRMIDILIKLFLVHDSLIWLPIKNVPRHNKHSSIFLVMSVQFNLVLV